MNVELICRRLRRSSVADLHRLRRLYPHGEVLDLIEEEASTRERASRPKGPTTRIKVPSSLNEQL